MKSNDPRHMTDNMAKVSANGWNTAAAEYELPRQGDVFTCETCGMQLQVTADCHCDDPDYMHLVCCGRELHKV